MNKYVVTYKALAMHYPEVAIDKIKADEIRAEIGKHHAPIYGRGWEWVSVEKTVTIEADSYSVSNEGSAHFYRNPAICVAGGKPALVATFTSPVTITIKDDPGVEHDSIDPVSFLAKVIEEQRLKANSEAKPAETVKVTVRYRGKDGNTHLYQANVPTAAVGYFIDLTAKEEEGEVSTVPVNLSFEELVLLRQGLEATGRLGKLDAKLYSHQVILRSGPSSGSSPGTP